MSLRVDDSPDDPDTSSTSGSSSSYTVCLLVDKKFVKAVKTLLEQRGWFGKKIETWDGAVSCGDGGGVDAGVAIGGGGGCGGWGRDSRPEAEEGNPPPPTRLLIHTTHQACGDSNDNTTPRHDVDNRIKTTLLGTSSTVCQDHVDVIYIPTSANTNNNNSPSTTATSSPLHTTILNFLTSHPPQTHTPLPLPKRWTIYPPLLLLPANTPLTTDPNWIHYLHDTLTSELRSQFYDALCRSVNTTHLAVNAPIPLTTTPTATTTTTPENIMRKPANITPVHGQGFDDLWVTCVQNHIYQTWKPMYTMFSRGNIVEKARILGVNDNTNTASTTVTKNISFFPGRKEIKDSIVVDLYGGIGYFAFPYARQGAQAVFAWEINPESVKGMVKGALRNGFDSVVVEEGGDIPMGIFDGEDTTTGGSGNGITNLSSTSTSQPHKPKLLIFNESNITTLSRLTTLAKMYPDLFAKTEIRHVNLGLLPSSRPMWEVAGEVLVRYSRGKGGWAHVHENVEVGGKEVMGRGIVDKFGRVVGRLDGEGGDDRREKVGWAVECVNTFVVKTYAPGVVHCVFDVWVHPGREESIEMESGKEDKKGE